MNKAEFIAGVAEKAGLTRKQAEAAVAAFTQTVAEALKAGDKVQLMGFGTFESQGSSRAHGPQPRHGRKHRNRRFQDACFQGGQELEGRILIRRNQTP